MQEILDFLQSLDWSPLVISIKTGIVATILSFFFGIFAARAVMKLICKVGTSPACQVSRTQILELRRCKDPSVSRADSFPSQGRHATRCFKPTFFEGLSAIVHGLVSRLK